MKSWATAPAWLALLLAAACGAEDPEIVGPDNALGGPPTRNGSSSGGSNGDDDLGDDDTTTPTGSHGVVQSFGVGGVATLTTRPGARLAMAADGRVLLLQMPTVATTSFEVAVLDANGQADVSFGSGGQTSVVIPDSTEISVPGAPLIDKEGRLVVPVRRLQGSTWGSLVARVAAGSLDASFGSGGLWDSKVTYSTALPLEVRNADGVQGYVVTVSHTGQPSVHRIDAGGQNVGSFGQNGVFPIPNAGENDSFKDDRGTIVLADGSIVLVSWAEASNSAASRYWLRHVTAAGALDTSYGNAGTAVLERAGLDAERGAALVAAPSGTLVGIVETAAGVQLQTVRVESNGTVSDGFSLPEAGWRWLRVGDDALLMWNAQTRAIQRWGLDGVADSGFASNGRIDVGALVGDATSVSVRALDDGGFLIAAATERTVDGTASTTWQIRRLAP